MAYQRLGRCSVNLTFSTPTGLCTNWEFALLLVRVPDVGERLTVPARQELPAASASCTARYNIATSIAYERLSQVRSVQAAGFLCQRPQQAGWSVAHVPSLQQGGLALSRKGGCPAPQVRSANAHRYSGPQYKGVSPQTRALLFATSGVADGRGATAQPVPMQPRMAHDASPVCLLSRLRE